MVPAVLGPPTLRASSSPSTLLEPVTDLPLGRLTLGELSLSSHQDPSSAQFSAPSAPSCGEKGGVSDLSEPTGESVRELSQARCWLVLSFLINAPELDYHRRWGFHQLPYTDGPRNEAVGHARLRDLRPERVFFSFFSAAFLFFSSLILFASCRSSCSFARRRMASTRARALHMPGLHVHPCSGQIHSSPPLMLTFVGGSHRGAS